MVFYQHVIFDLIKPRSIYFLNSVEEVTVTPWAYSLGLTTSGHIDMGLIFIAYQADLAAGFISTQNRLNGEPLEEYIKPFGGGYFFALPGIDSSKY